MKKVLSVLLAVLFCFSFCTIFASAANEDIIASIKGGTAQIGGTITVPIYLDVNKGFVTLGIKISYDSDVLEIVCEKHGSQSCSPAIEKTKFASGNNAVNSQYHTSNPYRIQWAYAQIKEDICKTGKIAAVTFRVKNTAKRGTTKVSVEIDQASCYSKKRRTFAGGDATIQIVCANHISGAGNVTKAPTCTENGIKTYLCTVCGQTAKTENIPAVGHSFGKWTVTKKPTCTESGEETCVCTKDAKHKQTREIKAINHKFGEWSITKKPTCTKDGEETRICSNNTEHKEVRKVEKLQHTVAWEIIKEPTATSEGARKGKCSACGEIVTETLPNNSNKIDDEKIETDDNPAHTDINDKPIDNNIGTGDEHNVGSVLEPDEDATSSEELPKEQEQEKEESQSFKSKNITILAIILAVFLVIIFVVVIVLMKKRL